MLGGVLGLVFGVALAAVIGSAAPSLTATTAGIPGLASSPLAQMYGQETVAATSTHVALSAPLEPTTLALGVLIAIVGGLFAGLIGSWRAARLSPSVALRNIG